MLCLSYFPDTGGPVSGQWIQHRNEAGSALVLSMFIFCSVFSKFRHRFYLTVGAVCYKCSYGPPHEEADRYKPNPWLLSLPGQAWSEHPSLWYNEGSKSLLSLRPASRAPGHSTRADYLMLLDLGLCLVLLLLVRAGLTHSKRFYLFIY